MRVTPDFFILCENAFADQTNKPTLVNIFNHIRASSVPVVGPTLTFAYAFKVKLDKKDEDLTPRFIIKSPSGELLPTDSHGWGTLNIENSLDEQSIGGAISVQSPILKEFGEYKVTLSIGDKKIASRSFSVEPPETDK